MSTVSRKNLRGKHVTNILLNFIKEYDCGEKEMYFRINIEGENTGNYVKLSSTLYQKMLNEEFGIEELEGLLNRHVSIGTRHIYVGEKIV